MDIVEKIIELRRELHKIPELSHDLPRTTEFVIRELEKIGLDSVRTRVGILPDGAKSCGVVAELKGKLPGKTLALRADMDALPICEDLPLPFASANGNMHACGHDAHTAILLGVATALAESKNVLCGTVRFIFQPAEETINGAISMVKDGAMDGVDLVIGLHTSTTIWKNCKPGALGYKIGALMASTDRFVATFKGVGGHGAMPQMTVDPVIMACHAVCQLQTLVSRETNPLSPAVVTIGMIEGGTAYNIIPPTCRIEGTLRTLSPETRTQLISRLEATIKSVASSMRGGADVEIIPGCGVVMNDREVVEKMVKIARKTLGDDMVFEIEEPTMGGEDFSEFLSKAKGAFFFHGGNFGDERDMPHHNPKFQLNEDTFGSACAAMTAFALAWQDS